MGYVSSKVVHTAEILTFIWEVLAYPEFLVYFSLSRRITGLCLKLALDPFSLSLSLSPYTNTHTHSLPTTPAIDSVIK